jgi:hypothetical protein
MIENAWGIFFFHAFFYDIISKGLAGADGFPASLGAYFSAA